MREVRVLNVGHGLCACIADFRDAMVYDCGTHGDAQGNQVARAWRRLTESWSGRRIGVLAVSHLHWDHYSGFLDPVPWVASDVRVIFSRLPEFSDPEAQGLRDELAARLIAFGPLNPGYGPLDIDLLRRIRRYAPNAIPTPLSRGEDIDAAGETWNVLWPPRSLTLGNPGLSRVRKAIHAYDNAAQDYPELADRLKQVRQTETYCELMTSGPDELVPREEAFDNETGPDLESIEFGTQAPTSLDEAGRALREAANLMSLVLRSESSKVLLTGDASRSAMNKAFELESATDFTVIVTPHHGGRGHVPKCFDRVTSSLWVSSAGGYLSHNVDDSYDRRPGLHHRTDRHGDAYIELVGDRLRTYLAVGL